MKILPTLMPLHPQRKRKIRLFSELNTPKYRMMSIIPFVSTMFGMPDANADITLRVRVPYDE